MICAQTLGAEMSRFEALELLRPRTRRKDLVFPIEEGVVQITGKGSAAAAALKPHFFQELLQQEEALCFGEQTGLKGFTSKNEFHGSFQERCIHSSIQSRDVTNSSGEITLTNTKTDRHRNRALRDSIPASAVVWFLI